MILVRVFELLLTDKKIVSHIISKLDHFDLNHSNRPPTMLDITAVNTPILKELRRLADYKRSDQPCLYHIFSLPGKVFNLPNLKQFQKTFNKSIQFQGKSFEFLKQLWKVTPKVTDGICWYLKWEHIYQMNAIVINRIARNAITITERLQLNKATIDKMKNFYKENLLPILIVEAGAIYDTRLELCINNYENEGKDTRVFSVYTIFDKLEPFVNGQLSFGTNSLMIKCCK